LPPADIPLPGRIPLHQNFSNFELAMTGVGVVTGIVSMALGTTLFGAPAPSIGPPAPDSFDRRWADRLHLDNGAGHAFLGQVPDIAGMYVLPYLPAVFYGIDAVAMARMGAPWWLSDPNQDHRLIAYAEALGWTLTATGVTKMLVGRERPYSVLDHPELVMRPSEKYLSFFSGHSAAMFCAATFVALDASRRLPRGPLAGASPARRFLVGQLLPYVVAYGTASLVAISRVIDQQHWPSDVLMGALVGTTIAHLAYLTHFDELGTPRRARLNDTPPLVTARLVPTLNGAALVGAF
jgi:membrane-associated phospholipid phosphatase